MRRRLKAVVPALVGLVLLLFSPYATAQTRPVHPSDCITKSTGQDTGGAYVVYSNVCDTTVILIGDAGGRVIRYFVVAGGTNKIYDSWGFTLTAYSF
jgi:hypothetical protein